MLTRVAGTLAIILGAAYWSGLGVPLHIHMALGLLVVFGLWGLAIQARRITLGLTLAGLIWGILVPVIGLAQLFVPVYLQMEEAQTVLRVVHLLFGLGTIGFAEMLAGRLKRLPA